MTAVEERLRGLRHGCARAVNGHGNPRPADLLALLPAAIESDRYGAEGDAYERLHGLTGRVVGDPRTLLTLDDLEQVSEPLGALLLELPQREIGGRLPPWDDLVAQVGWARKSGAALHLDGARLWECGPYYAQQHVGQQHGDQPHADQPHADQPHADQPYAAIAALFDTVYVSLYKGMGGVTGSCLAGPADLVAEAREWRHRHGGTLFAMWPYAASCLAGLRLRLDRVPRYVAHMAAIATALHDLDGVEVVPAQPPTNMVHLHLETARDEFAQAALRLAEQDGLWTWPGSAASDLPSRRVVELTVGDATLDFTPEEVRAVVTQLVAPEGGTPG